MDAITDELFLLFLFTIPGFFIVWTFQTTIDKRIKSDFEYLMFSTFWGVLLIAFMQVVLSEKNYTAFFENIFAGMIVLVFAGILFSWIIAQIFIDNFQKEKKNIFLFIDSALVKFFRRCRELLKNIFKKKKTD
jgi:hypothetical protein